MRARMRALPATMASFQFAVVRPRRVGRSLVLPNPQTESTVNGNRVRRDVGEPDPEWGEIVVAFVVPSPGQQIDTSQLDALCLEHIGRFKRPKRYEVVVGLPKNNYGKVLKTALREQLKEKKS